MRFLLLDRITKLETGKEAEGIKCWTMTDEIFNDHFPGHPLVPGVLLVESSAQLLGYLIEKSHEEEYNIESGVYVLLSLIHKAKFRSFVVPGDQCLIRAKLQNVDMNRGSGTVETFVEGKCVSEVTLSFVIVPKKDLPENKYMGRHEEYLHVITQKIADRFEE